MQRSGTPWVPSETELFGQLIAANASMHEMQAILSRSRGSITSKRARMEDSRRQGPRGPLSTTLDRTRLSVRPRSDPSKEDHRALVHVETLAEPRGVLKIPLLQLEAHHCRFPLGKGKAEFFCGRSVEKDKPYCTAHCKIVYTGRL